MLGPKPTFSDNEIENINSWKRNFPGWEIKIWTDKECIDWINESSFASYFYGISVFAYASDYIRCKILYEEGGLYMDTDVFCANPIPEKYFNKSFMAWDVWGLTTNNGTCFYASEPKLPIFKEFCDCMKDSPTEIKPQANGACAANYRVNEVLEKHGFKAEGEDFCEKDLELDEIVILNRSQFGVKHRDCDGCVTHGKEYYLIHACSGSWVIPTFANFVNLKYAIIDENTNLENLKARLKEVVASRNESTVVVLLASCYFETPEEILEIMKPMELGFKVYLIPCIKNQWKNALDFIFKRIADIKSCRNLLRNG